MELGKVLRKAAGVFVELPGDRNPTTPTPQPSTPAPPAQTPLQRPAPAPSAVAPQGQSSPRPAPASPALQRQATPPAPTLVPQRVGLHDASQTHPVVQPGGYPPPPTLQPPTPPAPRPPMVAPASPSATPPSPTATGLGFSAIYQGAKVPAQAFSAEQLLEMLASMPAELPLDTKRRTVQGMLQAMGKTTGASADTIVADATAKLNALSAHVEQYTRQAADRITTMKAEISALEQQIEAKRKAADQVDIQLRQTAAACHDEWRRLAEVLDFFNVSLP
jgi:hypothetical protein